MRRAHGLTLIELVVAIVIAGVIGAVLATYLTVPIRASADIALRAELGDSADTALRRFERDLNRALPNSVRVLNVGSTWYVEYLEVRTGGRYRAEASGAATDANACPDTNGDGLADEDVLTFGVGVLGPGVSDTCFRTLGALPDLAAIDVARDWLVVYNLGGGFADADAYLNDAATGGNKARILAVAAAADAENRLTLASNPAIPSFVLSSPGSRFHVVTGPVTYECSPATGRLLRHSGYPIRFAQPTAFAGATSAVVADRVSACTFGFNNGATERGGLVSATLTLTRDGESVRLYHEVHVANIP